jgi:hypothetical protein
VSGTDIELIAVATGKIMTVYLICLQASLKKIHIYIYINEKVAALSLVLKK